MKHVLVRSTTLAVLAAGAILGAVGVASADPGNADNGQLRGNEQPVVVIGTPNDVASAGPTGSGPVGPWAIFCMKVNDPDVEGDLKNCLAGLPD